MAQNEPAALLAELIKDASIAMLTTVSPEHELISGPVAI